MKIRNLLFATATLLLLGSCSTEEPLQASSDNPVAGYGDARLRTPEEILGLASDAINILSPQEGGENLGRGLGRSVDYKSQLIPIGATKSRSGVSEPLMYAVNYTDDNGYALISAHRNAPDVLAVTEHGNFDAEEVEQIEGLQLWIDDMMLYLEEASSMESPYDNASANSSFKTVSDTIWTKNIAPRVPVLWGQGKDYIYPNACEGLKCPNGIAGCGPLAMSMVMAYLERPTKLNITWESDNPAILLKWGELKKYLAMYDNPPTVFPSNDDYDIRKNLALLLREIGHRTNAIYRDGATGITKYDAWKFLHGLALTSSTQWENASGTGAYEAMFYNSDGILVMRGNDIENGGHQWICDGVQTYSISKSVYESTDNGVSWTQVSSSVESESWMIHHNWGWHGKSNGYYLYSVTKPNGSIYDFSVTREFLRIIR